MIGIKETVKGARYHLYKQLRESEHIPHIEYITKFRLMIS